MDGRRSVAWLNAMSLERLAATEGDQQAAAPSGIPIERVAGVEAEQVLRRARKADAQSDSDVGLQREQFPVAGGVTGVDERDDGRRDHLRDLAAEVETMLEVGNERARAGEAV